MKVNAKNVSQLIPGIIDELKAAAAMAAERKKLLHLAAEHGWGFVAKYKQMTKASDDPIVEKLLAANMAEKTSQTKKKKGTKRRYEPEVKTFYNTAYPAPQMAPNFGYTAHHTGGYPSSVGFPGAHSMGFPAASNAHQSPQFPGASFLPPPSGHKGQLVCFRCHGFGHKAPDCGNKRASDNK